VGSGIMTDQTAGKLPWTNEGKLLLITFNRLINEYGGRFSCWAKLNSELHPRKERILKRKMKRTYWMHKHARFVLDNCAKMTIYEMAEELGTSYRNISHITKGLGLRGRPRVFNKDDYSSMKRNEVMVLDLQTGIYYDSARLASKATMVSYDAIKNVLCGRGGSKKWHGRFERC